MKKTIIAAALLGTSMAGHATAPGGGGCGWGNLLFEGKEGQAMHAFAWVGNNILTSNQAFGITSGTNGCETGGKLTYSGQNLLVMEGVLEEVAADMAVGEGEALTALSVALGVPAQERSHFNRVMHESFTVIFPSEDVTAEQVAARIATVMEQDGRLSAFI